MSLSSRFVAILLMLVVLLPGCAQGPFGGRKRRAAEAAKLQALRNAPQFIGTVALVNEEGGFVLIDNEGKFSPPLGTLVTTQTAGAESGQLRLTEIRKRPFIIADLVKVGTQKGDEVFFTPAPPP